MAAIPLGLYFLPLSITQLRSAILLTEQILSTFLCLFLYSPEKKACDELVSYSLYKVR